MRTRLNEAERTALELVDPELLAGWIERLRFHAPTAARRRPHLFDLAALCSSPFKAAKESAGDYQRDTVSALFPARLALASYGGRSPGLDLVEVVEAFAVQAAEVLEQAAEVLEALDR